MSTTVAAPWSAEEQPPSTAFLIEKYLLVRDKKEALDKQHKEALKPYNEMLERLENMLLERLNAAGTDNTAVRGVGTAYKSTRTSVTCNAWSQTLDYIIEKEAWELLEARVNKTAALAIMEETKAPIPGVVVRQELTVNVRRA